MTKKFIKVLCFSCICLLAAACGEKENVYFQSETSVAETQRSEAVRMTRRYRRRTAYRLKNVLYISAGR